MFDGMTDVTPFFVGPEMWPSFAERLVPHLTKMAANSGGRWEPIDIASAIAVGGLQLWIALDGAEIVCAMTTEVVQYPRLRALRIIGLVGHRPLRWMHLLSAVEDAARRNFGASRMECLAPERMATLLRTDGWAPFHTLFSKDL